MRTRQILLLSAALTFAACQDRTATPLAPEAAPPEGPQLTFGTPQYDGANAAAVDRFGHIYVVGRTDGSLDGPNRGWGDFFIRKYHPEGEVLWADQYGTHLHDWANGVAVDQDGNAYVVGLTEGSLAGSRGGLDAFIRKYDTNGVVQWTRQFGGVHSTTSLQATAEYASAVAVNADGSAVYVAGTSDGRGFVRKFGPDGHPMWGHWGLGDSMEGIAVDPFGNVFAVGSTAGLPPDPWLPCCPQGGVDAFLIKYSADSGWGWAERFGTNGDDHAYAVTADLLGNAIIVGATKVNPRWGGPNWDAFVRKYSPSGEVLFASQFGTGNHDYAYAVTVDALSAFYVTGTTNGSLGGNNAGASDVFVRKFNSSNEHEWTTQFGTSADDRAYAIAARGPTNGIYVAGATAGTLVGANRGKYDAFLRRLSAIGQTVWTDQ